MKLLRVVAVVAALLVVSAGFVLFEAMGQASPPLF